MNNIIIITGSINSGKTTFLQKQIQLRNDVKGILTPKINGQRFFKNIETSEFFEMEDEVKKEDSICIGKYFFNNLSFNKAIEIIHNSIESNFIIIDEIGHLELKEEGFYFALNFLLNNLNKSKKIILVIRENLLDIVIEKFKIKNKILNVINVTIKIDSQQSIFN